MEKLKPCPFCGAEDVSLSNYFNNRNEISGLFVECEKCACGGPQAVTKEIAILDWNTRKEKP